ncbi:hypothetical protein Tco_0328020 [Tanacetum coccineum]
MIRGCYFPPEERRDQFHHVINCFWDFVMESLDEFRFISFHKIFRRLSITLLDVMELYGIFDVFLLLKDRSSSSLLDLFFFLVISISTPQPPAVITFLESASVYFKWEYWLRLLKHADILRPLLPNLLNTPPSFFFKFFLGDFDRSRLILENILRLGLGLRERLDRCPLSCFLVLIILNSEYRDVPEHFSKLSQAFTSFSTARDYVFPLVDAAYCTLVIFVYIVLVFSVPLRGYKIKKNTLDGCPSIEIGRAFKSAKRPGVDTVL